MKTITTAFSRFISLALLASVLSLGFPGVANAGHTAAEIDARVNAALARLKKEVPGSEEVLAKAHGVLILAEVVKAGFVVAGEGGDGELRIGGKTVGYYKLGSMSVGFQAGGAKRDIIMAFLDASELKKFQDNDKGWKVGADATVTVVNTGASGAIDSATLDKPIVSFIVGEKGLMAGISLDGTKISKLVPDK
jgi:lipid-binding SYLF domain-containing protein